MSKQTEALPQGWSVVRAEGSFTKIWPMIEAQITALGLINPIADGGKVMQEPPNFEQAVKEYIEDYGMLTDPEDRVYAGYTLTENDKALLLDVFMGFDFSPWLTAPPQPKPQPLTDEQARVALGLEKLPPLCVMRDVRAIEAAHSITGGEA